MLNNMSNIPATNLLDDYLRATATGQQCCEQAVHCSQVPAQTAFLHNQVLQGVHEAIDSAVSRQSPDITHLSIGQPRGTAAAARAWSPAPSKREPSSDSSQPATTPRGIFRAMRQADAAALYTEQLSAEQQHEPGALSRLHHLQQLHSDPVFAGTDSLASEVRLLADHAERSSKLLRLQQDMEIKSYRQKLLNTLQQPSALFDGHNQPSQQQQHAGQLPQTCADGMPRCSSAVMWQHSSSRMAQPEPRPCTAPKPHTQHSAVAVHSNPARPATAGSSGAAALYAGGLHSGLKQHQQQHRQQPAMSAAAAAVGYDSSSAGGLLAATAPPELQHLKILASLELPWKPPAATTARPGLGRALGSEGFKACSAHQQQQHHQQQQRAVPATPGSMYNSDAGQRLFLQTDHQQQQQECCSVPRPASAVAALQQSLGELAKLKAKYSQLQDQQEQQQQLLRMQQEQRWQQQQEADAERRAAKARRDTRLQAEADLQLLQQEHRTHTLHAAGSAAQCDRPAAGCGGSSNRACAWADQDTAGGLGPRLGSTRQQPRDVDGRVPYARWDSWQQQVHGQQQQEFGAGSLFGAAAGGGGVDRPLGSLGRQQAAQNAMRRSQSAPRLHRAWDAMPFESLHQHSNHPAERGLGLGYRSRSPGARMPQQGHLGASWEDGMWQLRQQQRSTLQELQRPKTAAACVGLRGVAGVGLGANAAGTRTAAAAAAAEAAAATGSCGVRDGAFSGWLSSSPLMKYTAGLRGTQSSAAAAAPTGRLGRGTSVHTVTGAQATRSSLNGRPQSIGASAAAATAGSWLPAGSSAAAGGGASVGQSHQQRLQGTFVVGASSLNQTTTAPRSAAAAHHSWLPQEKGPGQVPVGACKAALLASRAAGAAGVGGISGGWGRGDAGAASTGRVHAATTAAAGGGSGVGTSALRQELVQRALHGYKPHQVPRRSTANDDASSIASDASSASSWGAAAGGSGSTRRESAYAAALARVREAKQAARTGQRGGKWNSNGHDGDCSSSDEGGSTCG